jgi:glycosyltransferase involved in cell wall biosynthesis
MRLLFVVQRYGLDVFGGAEAFARMFASRLAARGHEVHVLTSTARDHVTWKPSYPAGEEIVEGVRVHRLDAGRSRDIQEFSQLQARVLGGRKWPRRHLQAEWIRLQGPWLPELPGWLRANSGDFDVTVFITYLYFTAWAGLPAARSPAVLHPTAHDEPPIYLPMFDSMFRETSALGYLTREEQEFVERRFRVRRPSIVSGIGIDLDPGGDPGGFRRRHRLEDVPYLACVGRIEAGKGSMELFQYFEAFKHRHPGLLKLVYIGQEVFPLPRHPDVVVTGFVSDEERNAGVNGAMVLVQPSYFESFSLVLMEAWAARVPAVVQGHSDVLRGQAIRAGAGLPYSGYAEFEAALELLLSDDRLRTEMGEAGRRYVERHFRWPSVLGRYEQFLDRVAA